MRAIGYWISTVLLGLLYLVMGAADVVQPPEAVAEMEKSGYPLLFFSILGVWKLLGGLVVLVPRLPRAKEWAYAGIFINLTAASFTHYSAGHPLKDAVMPIIFLTIAAVSYALRPASRRLAGPAL
jgi:uncharacterized membrane protein YphA (DoxX/SURF4 family)